MNLKFFTSFREKRSMILNFSSIIEAMTFVFFTFWGVRNNRYASSGKTIKASLLLKLEKFFLKLFIIMALVKTFFSNTRVQKHFRIKTHLGMSESLRLRLRSHSLMWTTCDYWKFFPSVHWFVSISGEGLLDMVLRLCAVLWWSKIHHR